MPSEVPWIWALEKGFYINLVLEIENVTLKAQLFWISGILCPTKKPITKFCKCCKYFLYISVCEISRHIWKPCSSLTNGKYCGTQPVERE